VASNSISRGILGWGSYLPYRRLDRSTIAATAGAGGGKGTRTVASFDEDTTTLGVEAARQVLRAQPDHTPASLWFATTEPAYLDKSNSSAVHAALRLPRSVASYDLIGSVRSALGALRAGLHAYGPALVVTSDIRTGLPGGPDESGGGDAAVSVLTGTSDDGPLAAEVLAWGSATEDVLDRWRTPGDNRSKLWEERFGETRYVPLAVEAWEAALKQAGVTADEVAAVAVTGTNDRVTTAITRKLGIADKRIDPLAGTVGNTGAAAPLLMLASAIETAAPGSLIALVGVDSGADAVIFRVTEAAAAARPARTVADQIALGGAVTYGRYLAWRGYLPIEPPRRPEPARTSASAAARSLDWKFGFVGSERADGSIHLPPSAFDESPRPMAEATGTVVTFTLDRLSYSQNPPVIFAVVDFDGGGRLPIELTDVDAKDVAIGDRVEMTFRRLSTADGVHNYFWKGRPVRSVGADKGRS
jgi:3-hydroxy-3-methylglutaryl CoA synthase/uncharacterized OB-fold protein